MPRKAPLPQIGVRMEQELRDAVTDMAIRHFGGNESSMLRESAILYINLRRKLGTLYEPTLALWLGTIDDAPILRKDWPPTG